MPNTSIEHQTAVARIHLEADWEFRDVCFVMRHPREILYNRRRIELCIENLNAVVIGRNGNLLIVSAHTNVQWGAQHSRQIFTTIRILDVPSNQRVLHAARIELHTRRGECNCVYGRVMPRIQRGHRFTVTEYHSVHQNSTGNIASGNLLSYRMACDTIQLDAFDVRPSFHLTFLIVDTPQHAALDQCKIPLLVLAHRNFHGTRTVT